MKYITTDKHPELKEGVELAHSLIDTAAGDDLTDDYATPAGWVRFDIYHIKEMLNRGYIKELQEPEFTNNDMARHACTFALYCYDRMGDVDFDYKTLYEDFLKQKEDEK